MMSRPNRTLGPWTRLPLMWIRKLQLPHTALSANPDRESLNPFHTTTCPTRYGEQCLRSSSRAVAIAPDHDKSAFRDDL